MTVHTISNIFIFNGRNVGTAINVTFRASPGDIISIKAGTKDLASINTVIDGRGYTLLRAFIDANVDTAATNTDLPIFASYGIGTTMRAESIAEIGLPTYLASGLIATAQATDGSQIHPRRKTGTVQAGFNVITLVPIDDFIETKMSEGLAARNIAYIPTLCMVQAIVPLLLQQASDGVEDVSFDYALANVKKLYDAGVRICAGTESNQISHVPISIRESLHKEMELLVGAGLSNLDALRAATIIPAMVFGIGHRGEISLGRRADMVLVEGDPLRDITATRRIRKVWIGGVEIDGWDAVPV
ncbi:putative hydrolase [Fusarium flagelliforme]|uniref:putative hydrolase n=1 Tax=Fusarium flagelliforme TaxID=2675880 RepID=UPI001E8D61E5|nr:putative hydrolase [Fusarium flagelliforme]KAH7169706.1 putative hydrolase [Fusarium flagelliforme]